MNNYTTDFPSPPNIDAAADIESILLTSFNFNDEQVDDEQKDCDNDEQGRLVICFQDEESLSTIGFNILHASGIHRSDIADRIATVREIVILVGAEEVERTLDSFLRELRSIDNRLSIRCLTLPAVGLETWLLEQPELADEESDTKVDFIALRQRLLFSCAERSLPETHQGVTTDPAPVVSGGSHQVRKPSLPAATQDEEIELTLLDLAKSSPTPLQLDLAIKKLAKEYNVGVKLLRSTYDQIEAQYQSEQAARKMESTDDERAAQAAEAEAERLRQEAADRRLKVVKERAQQIAQSADIPTLFRTTMRNHLGYIVSRHGAVTTCITHGARLLRTSMGFILSGLSGSGKSGLAEKGAQLLPPEIVEKYTSWSSQALSYAGDLTNKFILCGEIKPYKQGEDDDAQQQMRQLISENVLVRRVVERDDDGKLTQVTHQTRGPASVVMTTTREQSSFNDEFTNRQSFIYMNDSAELTTEVLKLQAAEAARVPDANSEEETEIEIEAWQEFHRTLQAMKVVIPFASQIMPSSRDVTVRRLFPLLLNYVRALALLHQHSRTIVENDGHPYVEAQLVDYSVAYDVVLSNAPRVLDTVSKRGREIFEALKKTNAPFTRSQAQKLLKMTMTTVKRYFQELVVAGCIASDGKEGNANLYRILAEPAATQELGLIDPSKVTWSSDHLSAHSSGPDQT